MKSPWYLSRSTITATEDAKPDQRLGTKSTFQFSLRFPRHQQGESRTTVLLLIINYGRDEGCILIMFSEVFARQVIGRLDSHLLRFGGALSFLKLEIKGVDLFSLWFLFVLHICKYWAEVSSTLTEFARCRTWA